ncbi:MAG: hypothetical protein IPM74_11480, partial [Crocinitomicaceae bacterium]|nr:hypothetical protein [Crocinitomicaceae bacterium]
PEDLTQRKIIPHDVYFYEKYVDDVHLYYAPKPTASIVYATEYGQRVYYFIPDIEYLPGYPAESASDCHHDRNRPCGANIPLDDSTRMGLLRSKLGRISNRHN